MQPKIFDPSTLEEWQQIDPKNWRTMVAELIGIFLESARPKHQALEQAWERRDWAELSAIAHSLKSSCGNVGALGAHTLLHELEVSAGKKDVVNSAHKVRELKPVFADSVNALLNYREVSLTQPEKAS